MGLLSGWPLIFQRLLTTLGFTLLRFIFMTIQKMRWRINGTANRIRDSRRPENYDQCAHVLDIVLLHKFDYFQACSVNDYILTHNRFESPQFIFDNDHVSLITIDEENSVFGVAREKGMHLWRFEYNPFVRFAQMFYCSQLIVVPLNHFHRMAEELGPPSGQLIFLFNTSRCGSTFLTQMMQTTGKCVSISEPDSFNVLAVWYRTKGDTPELRQLSSDVIRWTCRPQKDFTPLACMLKFTMFSTHALPMFKKVCPDSTCLFMYRNVLKVSQSLHRIAQEVPCLCMAMTLGKLSASLTEMSINALGFSGNQFRYKLWDDLSLGVLVTTVTCRSYLELRRKGFDISGLRYEDIVKNSHFAAKAILKFCGLPESLESGFLKGLDSHSQRGSILSGEILAKHKDPPLTAKSERLANEILRQNGLPLMREDWMLEGTITHGG